MKGSTRARHRWLRDAAGSRKAVNGLLVAVAAVAVLAAVLGPLLVRALAQYTVAQSVARAGAQQSALAVSTSFDGQDTAPFTAAVGRALAAVGTGAGAKLWQPPQVWNESTDNLGWTVAGRTGASPLVSRVRLPGVRCDGLLLVSGRCPDRPGEVALSVSAARQAHVRAGAALTVSPLSTTIDGPGVPPVRATVVGLYDASRATTPLTRAGDAGGTAAGVTADPLLLTTADAQRLQVPVQILGQVTLRGGLTVPDEPAARASVSRVRAAVLQESFNLDVTSGLPGLLDGVDAQVRSASVLVAVTEVQALALAVFALAVVLQRIAGARTSEWGIGRLRGVPRARWYASIYAEPAVALAVGALIGWGLGYLAGRVLVRSALGAQTPVEPWRWPVLAAAGAVLAAFAAALVVVSGPSLRRPLVELIQQRAEAGRLGTAAAVGQAAVVLLTAASLYELRFGGVLDSGGSQLGLLTPALVALTLALLAVRVAILLVRRVTARPPRTVAGLVVGRQTARTPSSLNPALVVAVGTALAVFATQLFAVSQRNQQLRATADVGAQTVLMVDKPVGADLVALVDAADPGGHSAMAVEERSLPTDSGVGRTLAVDTSRLTAVSAWSSRWADDAALAALRPPVGAAITLRGREVAVSLSGAVVTPGVVADHATAPADPELVLTVAAHQAWTTVALGSVRTGTLRAALPCADGCRLVSLGLRSSAGAAYRAKLTVTAVSTDRQPGSASTGWLSAAGWSPRHVDLLNASPRALATPTPGRAGLQLTAFDQDGGNAAAVLPPDAVNSLPALVAPHTSAQAFPGVPDSAVGRGLDGQGQLLTVVGRTSVLPRLLDDGVLMDLPLAEKLSDPSTGAQQSEVWLAPGASPQIEASLAAAGVTVRQRQDLSERTGQLNREPSTRAAAAASYLGFAALALTLIALVAARAAAAARRRPDWKSLLDGGLPLRTVRRLALMEIALPVAVGVVLGVLSGALGFALAAARLPLVDLSVAGPPLELALARGVLGGLGAVTLLVALAISAVAATVETRVRREVG